MDAYKKVGIARSKGRASSLNYINAIFTDFIQMHGDRRFSDDKAIICGIARLGGMNVTVIGIEKGQNTKDKISRNFGSVHPEGYRKAMRQMELAKKFNRPIICFIDTPGAFCGIGAEERGQGQAIAENLVKMMSLDVPIVSVLIGEGGSGGALALGVADEVWMLENSIYSIISPEGCASILWKDTSKAPEAAEFLKLTPEDLLRLGAIEKIIEENENFDLVFSAIKRDLIAVIKKNKQLSKEELLENRYNKFRRIGEVPL